MSKDEKAYRFDRIRAKTHQLAHAATAAGDREALLVLRLTMPETTAKQAKAQARRIRRRP